MILTVAELRLYLTRITYKPGWTIEVREGTWEGAHVTIKTKVRDSTDPSRLVPLQVESFLPPMSSFDQFHRWLAWRLGRIEIHEMREFLQLDGKPIFDPHAPNADRDLP